jgi:adenylate cyclase class IV
MIEVELKFEIVSGSWKFLKEKLDALPSARRLKQVENVDRYYDTTSFDLLQQAVFVRVRNHAQLEFKFNEQVEAAHIQCTERVFPLQSRRQQVQELNSLFSHFLPQWYQVSTVKEAIQKKSLIVLASIKKKRVQYAYEDLLLSIDHVEGLGDFFEVEAQCEEGTETNQAIMRLQRFVSDLALPTLRPVHVGYVELWLRLHHPQVYLLGKYRVEDEPEQRYVLQNTH